MSRYNDDYFNELISISQSTNRLLKDVAETQRQSTKATKKSEHKRTEVKDLVKGLGSVADLADKKEALNKLIDSTPLKNNRRNEMLEEYRQVDSKIKDYWDKKISRYEKGQAEIDKEFSKDKKK